MTPWYWISQVLAGGPGFEFEISRSWLVWGQFPPQPGEQAVEPAFKPADSIVGQRFGQDQRG